ncbi:MULTISPECIES: DUF2167 domain-containing protein [unclassified Mesorhizobium]|jgi:uncharacterized membrane-anchored protein|uniref:DUF2167 domain-containing protein n=1 Tax=unclassified Mesorhizobium TaxID=325217 RepID=UPI00112A53A5|nr:MULTISPECIES: DUF2167 domain-containing protein [unclassified Mesorhizobium]MBZ9908022.1 DUF2167 domain-containing protein [Mesorhizobium sp. BR115XR7A]MBZ9931860.1 DUF2167 domain-containing protein [Mesorhizobium sp. BR1-1-5]TPL76032.1 DUF2167 domain-containing protein [Mesorhizobium sp. B2-3-15]TPL94718.1 DUF2167 domain-containing protein [Mesorhizobium sp. B2-3-10]
MSRIALWLGLGLALSVWPAQAEKSSDFFKSYQGYNDDGKAFLDKIEPKIGTVDLAEGVHLTLGDKFYFLNKKDTASVLTEAWGNPASSAADSVGMIFPAKYDPIADGNWGIELRWEKIGYVDDGDAASIDYGELLRTMQADTLSGNDQRAKDGFPPITLIGWASPPVYDSVNKRLHWAKELQFGDDTVHTLNYDVRFLGKEGVFVMSYIATVEQLPEIRQSLDEVLGLAAFNTGKKYTDFIPGSDTVAAVGIGGLIAGKLAAKAGLLAVALIALKKFGLILLVPLAGVWRFIRGNKRTS